jgi:hypothetical protein
MNGKTAFGFAITVPILLIAALGMASSSIAATSDAWIEHAPTKEQVLKDVQGSDEIDTPARQMAAFEILRRGIEIWTGELDVRRMPPKAAAKFQEYIGGIQEAPYGLQFDDGKCSGSSCIRWRFYHKEWRYSLDSNFTHEVLDRYFEPQYAQAIIDGRKGMHAQKQPVTVPASVAGEEGFSSTSTILWSSFGAFVLLGWWVARKYRRTSQLNTYYPPLISEDNEANNDSWLANTQDAKRQEPPSVNNPNSIWDGSQWVNKASVNDSGSVWNSKLGTWISGDSPTTFYRDPDD